MDDNISSSADYKFVCLKSVPVSMRDGVTLAADVYLPRTAGECPRANKYPVLLMRTPYGKTRWRERVPAEAAASTVIISPEVANRHGYAIVFQDVRGTSESEGSFDPMINEAADGVDTLAWLREQSWCDGRVATFGPSYMGGVQMLLAAEPGSGLAAAFSQVAATDQFTNEWVYMDGVLTMTASQWAFERIRNADVSLDPERKRRLTSDLAAIGASDYTTLQPDDFRKVMGHLPVREMPIVRNVPWWKTWLDSRDDRNHFISNEMRERYREIDTPILHLGGWYDLFLRNTITAFERISAEGKTGKTRRAQRLVIGPWSHILCVGCQPNSAIDAQAMQLAWMDQWIRNEPHPCFDHRVVLYVMGENRWRAEETWPPAGVVRTRYYLHSAGTANTAKGSGWLSTEKPEVELPDCYIYDPRDPAPSIGGPGVFGLRAVQNEVEARQDVLVFSSSPLTEDVEVTGDIYATLYAASSATDTDWWMKLVDVSPDGTAEIVTQGVARARYRTSRSDPAPLVPRQIEKYALDMWATSNVFKRGHKIRVEVTSSNFPYGDRNPNNFVDLTTCTKDDFVIASQMIYHDRDNPSYIDLPIVPASRARRWIDTPFPVENDRFSG